MSAVARRDKAHDAMRTWRSEVSKAALAFESRWTLAALKRVDAELHRLLREQVGLFDQACITEGAAEIELQGGAMCRGYAAAVQAMQDADEPDDAYQLGKCPRTGFTVAIGAQKAAADRVREVHGERVVWVSPDEVASMLNGIEAFKGVAAVRKFFPSAEVIDRYPDEPAQHETEDA